MSHLWGRASRVLFCIGLSANPVIRFPRNYCLTFASLLVPEVPGSSLIEIIVHLASSDNVVAPETQVLMGSVSKA